MTKKETKEDVQVIGQRFVTTEELASIKSVVDTVNKIQMQIGGVELQKADLVNAMKKTMEELELIKSKLEETYGNVVVDLASGEIKENEPDTQD
jgi:hypothetical protein|tara:strand:- start:465 stop:746 length:282 start_codon:yes stop_codon:yes gene_type:complete